ncbi:hypothetical protein ABEB36_012556 [Hypothenemus hampei]|uniref:Uncharacterized protein n=1 Tax=Hypothenemus hampei TaxID=57062 RepID=A0ABD1EBZ7_HYPHA
MNTQKTVLKATLQTRARYRVSKKRKHILLDRIPYFQNYKEEPLNPFNKLYSTQVWYLNGGLSFNFTDLGLGQTSHVFLRTPFTYKVKNDEC